MEVEDQEEIIKIGQLLLVVQEVEVLVEIQMQVVGKAVQ